jgi:hypothetical protein
MHRTIQLLTAIVLLLFAGCVSVPSPTPAPATFTPPATPTRPGPSPLPTFTPLAPGEVLPTTTLPPSGEPRPTAAVRVHPLATRTGLAEVDRIIDVVLMEDREVLAGLIRTEITPCTTREGLGGPPKCAAGEREGTPVEVFPVGGPEGSFVRAAEIERVLPGQISGLVAVYKEHPGPNQESYWPQGDYALVFLAPDNTLLIVRTDARRIVRIDHMLGSLADLPAWVGTDVVLAPPA